MRHHQTDAGRRRRPSRVTTAGWPRRYVLLVALLLLVPSAPARAADDALVLEQQLRTTWSFGDVDRSFDLAGDRLVVADREAGVRYYRRSGTEWTLRRTIPVPFVSSLSISGGTLAMSFSDAGGRSRVELYQLDRAALAPEVVPDPLPVPDGGGFSGFGKDVALDGDYLVVGVDGDPGQRYALAFERTGGRWALAPGGGVLAPSGTTGGWFAAGDLDLSGDVAVVPGPSEGRVYRRTAAGWVLDDTLLPTPAAPRGLGGPQLAVAGETVVMVPFDPNGFEYGKTIYVYARTGGRWQVQQELSVPDRVARLDLSGSQLAVLAKGHVELWRRTATGWVEGPSLPVPGSDDYWLTTFDWSVALAGGRIAVADKQHDRLTVLRQGGTGTAAPGGVSGLRVVASRSAGTATVRWAAAQGGTVDSYVVEAQPELAEAERASVVLPASARSTRITGLRQLTRYTATVQARGPGGEGPTVRSAAFRTGGPATVASRATVTDPTGDGGGGAKDLTSLRLELTGRVATVSVRTARPQSPYTSELFRNPGGNVRILVRWRTPRSRSTVVQHQSTNPKPVGVPGEDFIARGPLGSPCRTRGARYVAGRYVATVPISCLDRFTTVRVRVGLNSSGDQTGWSPPVRRVVQRGSVALGTPTVASTVVGPTAPRAVTIRVKAYHRSGIRSAVLRAFSTSSDLGPVRAGTTRCRAVRKTTSYCSVTLTAHPGELRDLDAGRWRVFAQVRAKNGDVALREQVAVFSVRHRASLTATVSGTSTVGASGQLTTASWDRRRDVPLPGTRVDLQRQRPGSTAFATVASGVTDSTGRYAVSATSATGVWRLSVPGTATRASVTARLTRR